MASQVYDRHKLVIVAIPFARYKVRERVRRLFGKAVTVLTSCGALRGSQISCPEKYGCHRYTQFLGVPYGRPPVGELRFRDPQPVEPWPGVFNATSESKACQRDIFTARYIGHEDCLHLNIFTKQLEPDAHAKANAAAAGNGAAAPSPTPPTLVPVMVFFHGGAYMFGCNNKELYNPEYILRKDVLLVTVNYRLGAFGFLSVDDPGAAAPGNAGLKDQVLALRWIRDNIASFGGDPQAVTIFGESAGGCSVHYHLISPMSEGLFQRAIAMSGAVLTSWSVCPLQRLPERLATAVGWTGEGGPVEMMRVLRSAKADRLMRAQERLAEPTEKRQYMMFTFGPKVEPYRAEQCFIPEAPVRMCRAPWSRAVPVIFTACSNEGLLVHKATHRNRRLIDNLEERFQDMVPLDLMEGGMEGVGERDGEDTKRVAAEYRRFYFGEARMGLDQLERFKEMMSDKLFLHGIWRAIRMRLEHAKGDAAAAPTWYMRFDAESKKLNFTKFMFAEKNSEGACHADDCHYLFKTCIHPHVAAGSPEFVAIERFVNLFTEFARTGDPNGEFTRPLVQWDAVQPDKPLHCLNLADELTFIEMPEMERMRFWDSLYEKQRIGSKSKSTASLVKPTAENESATIPVASL